MNEVHENKRTQKPLPQEFDRWRDLIAGLPEARMEKVAAVKDALHANEYAGDIALDQILTPILEDLCGPGVG